MISILIASMGRPALVDTLKSLDRICVPDGESIEIIIADDSLDNRVASLVSGLTLSCQLTIVPVAAQNISIARNACIEAANGAWLAFVDDDEIVEPDWLEGHVTAARDFSADAVFGPVFPVYPEDTPDWFAASSPLYRLWVCDRDGRSVDLGWAGNCFLRREAIGEMRFDPAFGHTGGEDNDFFSRFAAAGNRMVVTNRARAHEPVPAERSRLSYVLQRAIRTGQLYARVHLRDRGRFYALGFMAGSAGKTIAAGLLSVMLWPFSRARALGALMPAASNLGKLREFSGAGLPTAWKTERTRQQ